MVGSFVMRSFRFSIILRAYSISSARSISNPTAAIQITRHGRNGNIREAESLFHRMPEKNIFVYTAMLSAYANNGQITNARKVFDEMPHRTVATWNAMITAYMRNMSCVEEACRLFARMPEHDAVSHSVMIKGFVNAGRLGDAERLFKNTPLEWRDPFCSNILMKGYFMAGNLEEAVRVFEGMLEKDVVSWRTIIDGYCKNGRLSEARKLFDIMGESKNAIGWCSMIDGYMKSHYFEDGFLLFLQMRREGSVQIDPSILVAIFQSCGKISREREGWQVHGFVSRLGFEDDVFVCTSMIAMYSRFGCIDEARSLFNMMSKRDVVSWNSLISGYVQAGMIEEANELFERMGTKDVFSWNTLITGFANRGLTEKCISLFRDMPERNCVSWNSLISGFANNGENEEAVSWFIRMVRSAMQPNAVTFVILLTASANLASSSLGSQLHSFVVKLNMEYDISIQNSLVTMYSRFGCIDEARSLFNMMSKRDVICWNSLINCYVQAGMIEEANEIFERMDPKDEVSLRTMIYGFANRGLTEKCKSLFRGMPERDCVSWNFLISGFANNGEDEEAVSWFIQMVRNAMMPDAFTFVSLLSASANLVSLSLGLQLHGFVVKLDMEYDIYIQNSLVTMYSRFGCIDEARSLFNMMSKRTVVSWNSLISGYVQAGMIEEANELFERMDPKDVVSWTTMISGFAKRGLTEKCISLFHDMPERNCVSWTSVISGFVNNGEDEEAISWFVQMVRSVMRPDAVTFVSLLSASANLASLSLGLQLHGFVVKLNMEYDISIQNSLVTMYSKCGNVDDAYKTFESITRPGIVSFDAMITGFAHNGRGEEALDLFRKLIDGGLDPCDITFIGVLSACRHAGLIEKGCQHFKSMSTLFKVEPNNIHYAIMVDLLGRAGLLDEATKLIESMPFEPHIEVWAALLGSSRTHMRPDIAKLATQKMLQLDPESATTRMTLSDVYHYLGEERYEREMSLFKRLPGIRKMGCSRITV